MKRAKLLQFLFIFTADQCSRSDLVHARTEKANAEVAAGNQAFTTQDYEKASSIIQQPNHRFLARQSRSTTPRMFITVSRRSTGPAVAGTGPGTAGSND